MRVLRSSLFVAATALVAAACGDKVTVPPAVTVTPTIHGVVVAPATATISVSQTLQLTAQVSADAGVTYTVAWTTTNSGVAGVTQTGLVNGAASGSAGICAAASAAGLTTVSNCATVVVQPPATIVKPVLQIASITRFGNLNAPVAAPPGTVAGQINVSLNLNPGTERMTSVSVLVNGVVAATQTFSSAQAAALRFAGNDVSAQALQQTLVFPINTAQYATTGCSTSGPSNLPCGTATWANGLYNISAIAYGVQGTSNDSTSAGESVPLLFNNADGWLIAQVIGPSSPVAGLNNANGFFFKGGPTASVSVWAVPVLYNGQGILNVTGAFGYGGCDVSGFNGGIRTGAMGAPSAANGTASWFYKFTRTQGADPLVGTIDGYEYNAACGSNSTGGEGAWVIASTYNNTNTGPNNAVFNFIYPVVRLDDRGPTGLGLIANAGIRTNSWFNDAVKLNVTTAVDAANGIVTAATDGGISAGGTAANGLAITYQASVTGGALAAATVMTTPALPAPVLAETSTPTVYTVTELAFDAFNNQSLTSANVKEKFGVDRMPPVAVFVAGTTTLPGLNNVAAQANTAGTAQGQVQGVAIGAGNSTIEVSETDPVGTAGISPSGFFSVTGLPLELSTTRVTNAATTNLCQAAGPVYSWATACGGWNLGTSFPTALIFAFPLPQFAGSAYYVTTASVFDQAGNQSNVLSRIFAQDLAAPIVSPFVGISPSTGTLGIGQAVTLTGNANVVPNSAAPNGLDMWGYGAQLYYGAASGGMALWPAWNTTATFFGGTFTAAPSAFTTSASLASSFTLINSLELATPALPAPPAAGTEKPFAATFSVANTWGGYIGAPAGITASNPLFIPATSVTTVASYATANMTAGACGVGQTWAVTAPAAAATVQRGLTGGATATSVTLSAVLTGTISVQANAFLAGVDFYINNWTGGWVYVGSATNVPAVTDVGATRTWTYSMTFNPSTVAVAALPNGFAGAVRAIGRGTGNTCGLLAGSALSTSSGPGAITIVP